MAVKITNLVTTDVADIEANDTGQYYVERF